MEHASVDLLLFHDIRLFKSLHFFDQLFDSRVNFRGRSLENLLEIFIRGLINLFISVLGRLVGFREENSVLGDKVFDLKLSILRDSHNVRSTLIGRGLILSYHIIRVLQMLNSNAKLFLVKLRLIYHLISVGLEVNDLLILLLIALFSTGQALRLDIVA
jgi:hypothetical protein